MKYSLKTVFDKYYREKPKAFIEILRENSHLGDEKLIEVLSRQPQTQPIAQESIITEKISKQIHTISSMFIGGEDIVN